MSKEITIKKAVQISGKSESTIRRLVKKYSNSQKVAKKNGQYYIDEDFLLQHFNITRKQEKGSTSTSAKNKERDSVLEHLMKQNDQLSERIKEQNHIIARQTQIIAEQQKEIKQLEAPAKEKSSKTTEKQQQDNTNLIVILIGVCIVAGLIYFLVKL